MKALVKVLNFQHITTMLPDGIVVAIDSVSDVLYIRFSQGLGESRPSRESNVWRQADS